MHFMFIEFLESENEPFYNKLLSFVTIQFIYQNRLFKMYTSM
jgi:hypothetical protein